MSPTVQKSLGACLKRGKARYLSILPPLPGCLYCTRIQVQSPLLYQPLYGFVMSYFGSKSLDCYAVTLVHYLVSGAGTGPEKRRLYDRTKLISTKDHCMHLGIDLPGLCCGRRFGFGGRRSQACNITGRSASLRECVPGSCEDTHILKDWSSSFDGLGFPH